MGICNPPSGHAMNVFDINDIHGTDGYFAPTSFLRGMDMTIGECIAYIQNKEMDDFIREIVEVEDKAMRIELFEKSFIMRTGEV